MTGPREQSSSPALPVRLLRWGTLAVTSLLVISSLVLPAQAKLDVISLSLGEAAFWNSPYILRASTNGGGQNCKKACYSYGIEVTEPGFRLRVALDYPMGNDFFTLRLIDPRGKAVKNQPSGFYSQELFVKHPMTGTWKVRVIARWATRTAFRLRAKLEAEPVKSAGRQPLVPNLRVEPPFQFSFRTPTTMIGGAAISGPDSGGGSCSYDETIENSAQRCLRLSVGPQNAGDGPLELRFSPMTDAVTGDAPMFQRVHYSDGSTRERRAGSYEYHKTHGHYHFSGFATLELFSVTDREQGRLEPAGAGHKSGFCFGDVMMNSWHEFRHDRAHSSRSSCGDFSEAYMGLSTGWTDIYDWSTPGNYVEFSDNPDGYYIVRATVDNEDVILETNENDNISYAYIRVHDETVEVLERGYGTSPWDPHKLVAVNWVKALR